MLYMTKKKSLHFVQSAACIFYLLFRYVTVTFAHSRVQKLKFLHFGYFGNNFFFSKLLCRLELANENTLVSWNFEFKLLTWTSTSLIKTLRKIHCNTLQCNVIRFLNSIQFNSIQFNPIQVQCNTSLYTLYANAIQ